MTLAGKVVVVTGGARGIGRGCVVRAASLGAHVVFCSRNGGDAHREVEAEAAAAGGMARGIVADVTREDDVARLLRDAGERFGPVDGVVCNAATLRDELLVSTTTEGWDAVVEANLTGGFAVVREALRAFLSGERRGRIVAIGSISQRGVSGNASYAVAKGGMEGLVREVARRYAPFGIAATMVVPGYVETGLSAVMSDHIRNALIAKCPMRRPGTREEIAAVVCHLLGGSAATLSGETVFVSGGLGEVPA